MVEYTTGSSRRQKVPPVCIPAVHSREHRNWIKRRESRHQIRPYPVPRSLSRHSAAQEWDFFARSSAKAASLQCHRSATYIANPEPAFWNAAAENPVPTPQAEFPDAVAVPTPVLTDPAY